LWGTQGLIQKAWWGRRVRRGEEILLRIREGAGEKSWPLHGNKFSLEMAHGAF